jgi:hypothetical protein
MGARSLPTPTRPRTILITLVGNIADGIVGRFGDWKQKTREQG